VRLAVCVLIALLVTACGSAEPAGGGARYGISLDVPDGVSAEVSRGRIRIATSELSVVLFESEPSAWNPAEEAYFNDDWPVQLDAADFGQRPSTQSEEDARLVSVAGRFFSLIQAERPASTAVRQIERLNEALAGIEVRAGDFYRGFVQPIEFPERPGWHAISSGPRPRYPHGEDAHTAAATIPYRDGVNEHPHQTFEALPQDGIVIRATLSRSAGLWAQNALRSAPPYRLRDFVRSGCPGKACEFPEHVLVAAYGDRYRVEIRVYFGRFHPTDAMRAEADAMLAGLRFPDWGPWELEPA
jgi:hypothetical protein